MSRQWMLCGAVVLATAGAQPADVAAQASPLAGTWVLDVERSQNTQEIIMAVRSGGGRMIMRGSDGGGGGRVMMRGAGGPGGEVMAGLQGGEHLRIQFSEERVTVRIDNTPELSLPLSGAETVATRWGQRVKARARLAGSTLTIETVSESGMALKEVFGVAENRELHAELHVRPPSRGSDAVPQPVVVKRVYTPTR